MSKFKISIWSKSKDQSSEPLGKSYGLKNGKLIHENVGTNANHLQVVDIKSLDDLIWIMDFDLYNGDGFITSGVPKNTKIKEAEVTIKDRPKKGYLSRSKDDIEWRAGTGTNFVIDYDPDCSNDGPKTVAEIRHGVIQALELAGVDISKLQMLAYPSSSSGFVRRSDGHSFDKGGRHLIFLVKDAGDLERFEKALFVFMTLAGLNYGAVSNAGHLLERGVMDRAAVSPTQPTFAGIPAYRKKDLTNVREKEFARRLGGSMLALDTKMVRDPTDAEMAQYRGFWEKERLRLQPEIEQKKRQWLANQGQALAKNMPDASPEQVRGILEQRWSGHLAGSDVITLDGFRVTVSEILINPDKYDGKTGPDPIEPDYRNGAQTCKVSMNRSNGRPMIYSQAHGGINYRLWYDTPSVLKRLRAMDTAKAQAALKTVLHATRPNDSAEAEWLLRELAKLLKTTKKSLTKVYTAVLCRNMLAVSPITEDLDHVNPNNSSRINDLAHIAAQRFISEEQSLHTDESQVWRYNGTHFEKASDLYLGNELRKILTGQGWESKSGLTRITREAVAALKQQTHMSTPIVARRPKRILNFGNGELHLSANGEVELREHDPSSGLTSVLPIDYDPNAEAPVFQQTIEELFWPPAYERMKPRSTAARARYEKAYRNNAKVMREHVEEVLAYLITADRWIAAWFLWIGGGANGKTLLTKVMYLLLDDNTIESDRLQAFTNDSFGMERLIGKTLLIDDDLDTNTTIPDGFVKKISESKPLSANRKYQTSLTFHNRCALLLLANNYPRMMDMSWGTTRRIHSIEFTRRFYNPKEIDAMDDGPMKDFAEFDLAKPHLIDEIAGELPGVVNVLVRAYRRLIKRDGFSLPDAVKESNDELLRQSNPLPMFINTQCGSASGFRIRTSEFARALRLWISEEHIHWDPSNHQIRAMMRHLGQRVVTIDGYEHYMGIDLKTNRLDSEMLTDPDDGSDDDDWDEDDEDDDYGN